MAAAAVLAACAAPARANFIANGSFEDPVIASNASPLYLQFNSGSSIGGAWTVGGNDVLLIRTNYTEGKAGGGTLHFNAYDGDNVLDLTGHGNTGLGDSVAQLNIATVAGQAYKLSFALGYLDGGSGTPYPTGAAAILYVGINNGAETQYSNSTASSLDTSTQRYVNYQIFNQIFTASSSTTSISFRNGTLATNFVGLDKVSLVSVPEPTSVALSGIGLLGMGAFGLVRRFRARKLA
jgi:hypothetical protein